MILNRLGNKTKVANKIIPFFPSHNLYVEPFFGAGGMFFSKQKAKYNILNDKDEDVFNLFNVLRNKKQELYDAIYQMPIHEKLWHYWRKNKEIDPVNASVRFLFLSNFGYMGKSETLRYCNGNQKKLLLEYIDVTYKKIWDCEFMCFDFLEVFNRIPKEDARDFNNTFIYCDPPYLDTTNNYQHSFTEEDSFNLFDSLCKYNFKFAVSEFNHPFIIEQSKDRGLYITNIGERVNMKNRRNEILVTNYSTNTLFNI